MVKSMTTREDEEGPREEEDDDTVDEGDNGRDCGEAMLAHSVKKRRPMLRAPWWSLSALRLTQDLFAQRKILSLSTWLLTVPQWVHVRVV